MPASCQPSAEVARRRDRRPARARALAMAGASSAVVVLIVGAAATGYFAGSFAEAVAELGRCSAAAALVGVLFFVCRCSPGWAATTRSPPGASCCGSGLFVRTRQELLHSRGYDVTVRKAGLQPLFGSGDVLINTGLEHPVVLRDVPGADLVQAALHDLMERSLNPIAARRQQEQSRAAGRRRRSLGGRLTGSVTARRAASSGKHAPACAARRGCGANDPEPVEREPERACRARGRSRCVEMLSARQLVKPST